MYNPQLQVVKLDFVETGTYNPMYLRPYETIANDTTINQIEEATLGGQRITANALAGAAGSFIRPVANPMAAIDIQNGWATKRLRFIAELHYPMMHGGRLVQYVSGWTNHLGVGRNNALDPMMTLHINESILLQEIQEMTPVGLQTSRRIVSAAQVLSMENYQSFGHTSMNGGVRTLRPEDLFATTGVRFTYGAGQGGLMDLRQGFLTKAPLKKTHRRNGSASHYLARTISSHNAALANAEYDASPEELAHNASASAMEDSISKDHFLSWLKERNLLNNGGSVTWGELCRVAPEADHVARFFVPREAQQMFQPTHVAGATEEWKGGSTDVIFANILGQSVPSVMMDCMLTKLHFRATNRLHDPFGIHNGAHNHHVALTWFDSVITGGMEAFAQAAVEKLRTEVMPNVSMSGLIDYQIDAQFDIFGESYITISVGGSAARMYCIASFCDSLVVPVITPHAGSIETLASDVDFMLKNLNRDPSKIGAAVPLITSPYGF